MEVLTWRASFGNSDFDSDEHYSSRWMKDGYLENEYRLKKKYWNRDKTNSPSETNENEYIVAGDADSDAKLEVMIHR